MDPQQQQQQKPGIQPALSDLDPQKPAQQPAQQQNQDPNVDPNLKQPPAQTPGDKPDGDAEPETDTEEDVGADTDTNEDSDPAAFYAEISKLRGDSLQFNFPEGVDPSTPAGVHHAIGQAVEYELDRFEDNLMKGDPRAYAYMLHRNNGGSDEDFFATKTEVLPEWDVLKGSVDLQQAFYRRVLARKEIAPDQIDILVKDAIEKNKLVPAVEAEYNRMKKQDEDQARHMLAVSEQNQKKQEQMIQRMGALLQEKIINNKDLGITIPDAKRGEFLQFVNQFVHLDAPTGQWYFQQPVTNENINTLLESLYYQNVNGNLDEIISNRAKQNNVKQIRLNMGKAKTKTQTSTQVDPNKAQKPGVQPALSTI